MVPLTKGTSAASVRSPKSLSSTEVSIHSGRIKRGTVLPNVRFNASLLTLCTVGLTSMLCHAFALSDSGTFRLIGNAFLLLIASFGYEWTRIYASALTRVKQVFFNEANILETNPPHGINPGRLFIPDPPTPDGSPRVKFSDGGDVPERSESERAQFDALRKQHAGNEFEIAQRLMKEQDNAVTMDGTENVNTASEPSDVETPKEKSAKPPSSVRTAIENDSAKTAREKSRRD